MSQLRSSAQSDNEGLEEISTPQTKAYNKSITNTCKLKLNKSSEKTAQGITPPENQLIAGVHWAVWIHRFQLTWMLYSPTSKWELWLLIHWAQ